MKTIPGTASWAALAAAFNEADPATANAPRNRYEFRRAARDLVSRGYSTSDAAAALKVTKHAVLELLAEAEPVDPLARFKL